MGERAFEALLDALETAAQAVTRWYMTPAGARIQTQDEMAEEYHAARAAIVQAFEHAHQQIDTLREQLREADLPHREWAIANVQRAGKESCPVHGTALHLEATPDDPAAPCQFCYGIIRYREGQVAAGAFHTLDEVMAYLARRRDDDPPHEDIP
jgi:hypothetical protein